MSQLKRKTTNEEEFKELTIELFDEEPRYTCCPRCGSETWEKLYTNKFGEPNFCDECKGETRH